MPSPMCEAERSTSVSSGGREPDLRGMAMSCDSVRSPTLHLGVLRVRVRVRARVRIRARAT